MNEIPLINTQAQVALKNLFVGVSDAKNPIPVQPIKDRLSVSTFHNYVSQVNKAGLAIAVKDDPNDKRITTKLVLTATGKEILQPLVSTSVYSSGSTVESTAVSLDDVTRLTDKFNKQNKTWKWVLVRKNTTTNN